MGNISKKPSILIGVTGPGGLLGSELIKQGCLPLWADVTNFNDLNDCINKAKPDIIVHCAAKTNVNEYDKNPYPAMNVNVGGTANLAKCFSGKIVYISTEYVFDGKSGPYAEDNISFNPLNIYGLSKLGGEIVIRNRRANDLIVRITTPFGIHPKKATLASKILNLLDKKKTLTFSDNLITSPSYIPHLAQGIIDAINFGLTGVLNIAGSQIMSLRYFAQNIAYVWGYDENLIKSGEFSGGVPRPQKAGLIIDKAKNYNIFIGNPIDGLKEMKNVLETGDYREISRPKVFA